MAATDDPDGVIARALQTARELTGMDLAFVGHFDDGREIIRHADGDEERFGMVRGAGLGLEATYCQRMVDGRLPSLVPDTAADPVAAAVPATTAAGVGAYLGVPLRRGDGSLYGTFCCIAGAAQPAIGDEHVRLMQALAQLVGDQLDRLEAVGAAQRAQSAFFTSITHDVRTPLTVITGYAEELVSGAPSPEVAHDWALRILRNAERLDGLLDDVLLLARAEAGALEGRRRPVDLGALAGEAVGDAEPAARAGGVQLETALPDEPVTLQGDAGQLRRVLDNLLSNAVKYSPAGGPVTVRLRADGPTAILEVGDRGIGIPAAEVEHLFTRFYRASTVRDGEIRGSGLGLSISRSIVAAHEGTIAIESEDGAGTTVRVRLPLTRR